jgi:glutathione S-transferase
MADITLYELPGCPYCGKVIDTLEQLGLEYDTVEVPSDHAERTEVKEVSGQTSVPVIVDEAHGVEAMNESDDIVEYLERTYAAEA